MKGENSPVLKGQLLAAGALMGILQEDAGNWLGYAGVGGDMTHTENYETETLDNVHLLMKEREKARKEKNFKRADEIRDELKTLGFTIEDTAEGPKARKIS